MHELSRKARRALEELRELAGAGDTVTASWAQIAGRAGMSRSATAQAMRELAFAGEIMAINREAGLVCGYRLVGRGTQETAEAKRGHKLQACSDSMTTAQNAQNAEPVYTGVYRCRPVHTSTPPDELSTDEFDDDDGRAKKISGTVNALLGEFGMAHPFSDMLVKELVPAICKNVMTLDDARAICARTAKEAAMWRQPRKIMFVRLRTRARGELQDPLPLILEMPAEGAVAQAQQVARQKTAKTYQRRGATRRPQVQYTEEQREAARETARRQIAERAARHGAQTTGEMSNG